MQPTGLTIFVLVVLVLAIILVFLSVKSVPQGREYPVERFYRNAKGSNIYEGTREMQTLIQADYALGLRVDKPRPVELPEAEQEHEHNW